MILFGFRKKSVENAKADVVHLPRVKSASVSETGLVRADNQDHIYVDDDRLVYCVADGVGGGAEGARASEIVCANLKMVLYAAEDTFAARVRAVRKAIDDSNAILFDSAREKGVPLIASTLAVLIIDPANPCHVAVCNVGDSRVYRFRRGMPEQLSKDHRLIRGDHTLTRAIGATDTVEGEWSELTSPEPARFLLCTDGVTDVVNVGRLAVHVTAAPSLAVASERIAQDVVRHGAPDNFSFIVISVA